ncbi:MAG: transposase [Anaerolineales bacterium]|nr:transposase [Anaerolineales bacterium]
MSSSQELYNRIVHTLARLVTVSHIAQLSNWAWLTVGILQSQAVALGAIATYLPWETKAESRIARLRRWLRNPRVQVWEVYRPLLAQVLGTAWQDEHAFVILDGLMVFGNHWQIFRLSLEHGCRAIPLAWVVIPGKGLVRVERLQTMLEQVAVFLRPRVKGVTFLADRGFRDCDWADLCRKIGWHYAIRIMHNTWISWPDGRQARLDEIVPIGLNRYFQAVALTQAGMLTTNVSVTWTEAVDPEMVAIVSDQPAGRQRLQEYGHRMRIEQSFRDDQSGGFDLEHTQLRHADRLERLLLAVAVATLWCHELGQQVLFAGEATRQVIDPGYKRELSVFQLGLRWLKRCASTALQHLDTFRAHLVPIKLKPVVKIPAS